jgi:hypothetical protein
MRIIIVVAVGSGIFRPAIPEESGKAATIPEWAEGAAPTDPGRCRDPEDADDAVREAKKAALADGLSDSWQGGAPQRGARIMIIWRPSS